MTGALGTDQSQPGNLQPGYFCTGIAVWEGPFPAAEMVGYHFGVANEIKVIGPGTVTGVPLATASQMAAGDASWWTFH